jgi:outer membrane biogenesis lipoprotein LolB
MRNTHVLLTTAVLALSAHAVAAETVQLRCEFWHKRLGQLEDKTYAIDFDAGTCNGQPCKISATELKWQAHGGREEFKIDRVAGEGTLTVLSDETAVYKNCKATKPKS